MRPSMHKAVAAVSLIVAFAFAFATIANAHGGNPDVMGTVTAIDEKQIEVKTSEGKIISVHLTKDTKYFKGDIPAVRADVKIGMRAVLHLEGKGEHLTVHEVQLPSQK